MSRAFLKNESADDPVVIPARAPLPPGMTNYVTSRGLSLLRSELADLEEERSAVQLDEQDEADRSRQLAELNGRLANLNQRIATAKVVNLHNQPPNGELTVRFGATITLKTSGTNKLSAERRLTIVGVDEADAALGLVAFTSPIARAMQGKHVGEQLALRTMQGENLMEITSITYEET